MSFNDKMHPRNIYKTKKPNFKLLAEKYEKFKEVVKEDAKGRVHVDFREPECLKLLTWVLLKEDFNLDVDIPLSRLIPTVPLRLNYLLWVEDLFAHEFPSTHLRGFDIGTGALCIYPLLGARMNQWTFIASETDPINHQHALHNVEVNKLKHLIHVQKVDQVSTLEHLCCQENISFLNHTSENFGTDSESVADFCICNPPFFESMADAWGVHNSRSSTRPESKSVSTASEVESICDGGEVEFVRRVLIRPSEELRKKVKVYTTMLGKKSSLKSVIGILRQLKVPCISTTEFGQGHTMRWAVAWSYLPHFSFKKAERLKQTHRNYPPFKITPSLPPHQLSTFVQHFLEELKFAHTSNNHNTWQVVAYQDTWSHQRRRKRKMRMLHEQELASKRNKEECTEAVEDNNTAVLHASCHATPGDTTQQASDTTQQADDTTQQADDTTQQADDTTQQAGGHGDFIVKFSLKIVDSSIEFGFIEGLSVEIMHQIYQNFKNRLASFESSHSNS